MELHGRDVEGLRIAEEAREVVRLGNEDGVRGAGEASEDVGAEVLVWWVSWLWVKGSAGWG